MSSVQFWSLVSCFAWFFVARFASQRLRDPLNPVTVFSLFFLIGYPLKLILTTVDYSVIDSNQFGEGWQLFALLLSNIAALAFCIPFIRAKAFSSLDSTRHEEQPIIELRWVGGFIILFILAAGPEALPRLFSLTGLQEWSSLKNEHRVGRAFSSIATYGYTLCLAVHMWQVVRFQKPGIAWRILLLIVWTLLSFALLGVTNSKYSALLPLALYVLLKSLWRVRQGAPWTFRRITTLGFLMISLFAFVGYARAFGVWGNTSDYNAFELALRQVIYAFDMPDNLTAIVYRMDDLWFGDLYYQPTLQNVLYSLVPRFVWPEKPLIMSNLYIMQHYLPERFTDYLGEVVSPSMPGELMVSGGMFFLVVGSLLLGWLYRFIFDKVHAAHCSTWSVAVYIWLTVNIFNVQRSGTGIVSTTIIFGGVAFIILTLLEGKRRGRPGTTRQVHGERGYRQNREPRNSHAQALRRVP